MARILVITEKDTSAKKISEILSGGRYKTEKKGSYRVYTWESGQDSYRVFGIRGHILKADFPEEYSQWEKVPLSELVRAPIEKKPIVKTLVTLVRSEAKHADSLIVATDFDREGELIGVDTLSLALSANKNLTVKRARFSALTPDEIQRAFAHLEDPYYALARAGEARQDIDLVWGATLTRFISLASRRLGKFFLSVGRVQTPTLCLIVKREREIETFVPTPYFQIEAVMRADGAQFSALHKKDRFLDRGEAEAILARLGDSGTVTLVQRERKKIDVPTPFSTTDFLSAAASIGVSPAKAMRIAENLYTQGFISYPRTDNTVYPKSLDLRSIAEALRAEPELGSYAARLLEKSRLTPSRGKRETTDHPPIYPTGIVPENLSAEEKKVYQLVVQRFLATLSDPAEYESQKAEIDVSGEPFSIRGFHLISPGFLEVYPYRAHRENEIPPLVEGQTVEVIEKNLLEKETQPPARYSQARLIKLMEELGLGTKATRHSIIQNLYDRGYVVDDPVRPTQLGVAVATTIMEHIARIADPAMTADIEEQMNEIAEGRKEKDEVVEQSREVLLSVLESLTGKEERVKEAISEGARLDQVVGSCPACGGEIIVRKARKTKKRFLGCSNYPECTVTYPLPQKGLLLSEGKACDMCGAPTIKIVTKGRRPWVLCPNPQCSSKEKVEGE